MKNLLTNILTGFGVLFIFTYGIGLIVLGYIGIEAYLSTGWAIGGLILALLFRFTLPMIIGSVYGAMIFFGVNAWIALIIVMPNLIFVLPTLALTVFAAFTNRTRQQKITNQYIDAEIVS